MSLRTTVATAARSNTIFKYGPAARQAPTTPPVANLPAKSLAMSAGDFLSALAAAKQPYDKSPIAAWGGREKSTAETAKSPPRAAAIFAAISFFTDSRADIIEGLRG